MSKLRVLLWETLSDISGGQKMTLRAIDLLREGCDFFCLLPGEGKLAEELRRREIPCAFLGDTALPAGRKNLRAALRYARMSARVLCKSLRQMKKFMPDLLYAPGPAALPWSALCGSLFRRPVIWHLHHNFLDSGTKRLLNFCAGWKSVRSIIVVSACVGSQIPDAQDKLHLLYNPIDVESYKNGDSAPVLRELGMDARRPFLLGQIAAIQRSKRQEELLHILAEFRRRGIPSAALFAGAPREADYMEELVNLAEELRIRENVYFLGHRSDIANLLKAMDALLIPSEEGLPLAALEAMAAGCPIVARDCGGSHELLTAAGCGKLYRTGASAAEIADMLLQPVDASALASGAAFCRAHSPARYGEALRTIFEEVGRR